MKISRKQPIMVADEVESITGICPLCDKDTTQYLFWLNKNVRDVD